MCRMERASEKFLYVPKYVSRLYSLQNHMPILCSDLVVHIVLCNLYLLPSLYCRLWNVSRTNTPTLTLGSPSPISVLRVPASPFRVGSPCASVTVPCQFSVCQRHRSVSVGSHVVPSRPVTRCRAPRVTAAASASVSCWYVSEVCCGASELPPAVTGGSARRRVGTASAGVGRLRGSVRQPSCSTPPPALPGARRRVGDGSVSRRR